MTRREGWFYRRTQKATAPIAKAQVQMMMAALALLPGLSTTCCAAARAPLRAARGETMRIRHGPGFGKARIIRAGEQRTWRQRRVKLGKAFHLA